jgi:beta-fructofuranosidase
MRTSRRNFVRSIAASGALASPLSSLARSAWPLAADSTVEKLVADPLRPQFHLLPAKNWMNDPNAPIFWQGRYHMFFQYNPGAAVWGDMHWAHAVSDDMVHWRNLPVALSPTPGWDDADGCFTGSAVDDHGVATILYTGVKSAAKEHATLRDGVHNYREVQCLATSADPDLRTWDKYKQPVIQPPNDPALAGFRDPFLWRQDDNWILGVGSGHYKQGGCVLLYRSKDLRNWEPLHELASGHWTEKESVNPVDSGEMWECPDFFPLGKKHVLLYSTAGSVIWESGELDPKELKFHSQRRGVLDHGAYYAQKTQLDADGNRILWGWIPEKRPDSELIVAGWAGCMALPRVLSLSSDGDLQMTVAAQTHSLREKTFTLPMKVPSSTNQRDALRADTMRNIALQDFRLELAWKMSDPAFSLTLEDLNGPWWSAALKTENSAATLTVNGAATEIPATTAHEFHLFLDASVAELIVDQRHALTTRIYRQPSGPLRVKSSDVHQLESFQAWQLRPISPDRLTS